MKNTKIKTFKFEVCNVSTHIFNVDKQNMRYKDEAKKIISPDTIDKTINDFIADKDVININIKTVEEHYHNNGRGNTVALWIIIHYTS